MLAFTICSNNYFAYATVLANSWVKTYPDKKFVIVLVDELNSKVNYKIQSNVEVIALSDIKIQALPDLVSKYNIIELNTAIKPDAFLYLYNRYNPDAIIYLDPDTKLFTPFEELQEALKSYSIVVTPHFLTPIDDDYATTDIRMIGSGLFNLGFIALGPLDKVQNFLTWWRDRLYKYCYYDLSKNMFYDQVWCNYIPVFFENYLILKHLGYNAANWNFHERYFSKKEDDYLINDYFKLRFFHFSGYKHSEPSLISRYHDRFNFSDRPDVVKLFNDYQHELLTAGAEDLSRIPCIYFEQHKEQKEKKEKREWEQMPIKSKIKKKMVSFVKKVVYGI